MAFCGKYITVEVEHDDDDELEKFAETELNRQIAQINKMLGRGSNRMVSVQEIKRTSIRTSALTTKMIVTYLTGWDYQA